MRFHDLWAWGGPSVDGRTMAAVLVAVLVVLPRVLTSSRSLRHRPRLALALWSSWGALFGLMAVAIPMWLLVQSRWVLPWDGSAPARPAVSFSVVVGGFAATTLLGTWGVLRVVHAVSSRRRALVRHLRMVELVGTWDSRVGAVVIDADPVAAYCVPGLRQGPVVLTRGVVASAEERELVAVVEHERAHARGRHGLLVMAFVALQWAVPFSRTARLAVSGVITATEMIADEAAARSAGCVATIRALHLFDRPHAGNGDALSGGEVGALARDVARDAARDVSGPIDPGIWIPGPVTLSRVRRLLARAESGAC